MTSIRPGGSARATCMISSDPSHDDKSVGVANSLHRPPACAATITTDAPAERRRVATSSIVSASGATRRPRVFAAIVADSAPAVMTPTMPTRRPAALTTVDGATFCQATGWPVVVSIRFAARNGNDAWAARAFSAPRGSSLGRCGVAAGPTGPKSNS